MLGQDKPRIWERLLRSGAFPRGEKGVSRPTVRPSHLLGGHAMAWCLNQRRRVRGQLVTSLVGALCTPWNACKKRTPGAAVCHDTSTRVARVALAAYAGPGIFSFLCHALERGMRCERRHEMLFRGFLRSSVSPSSLLCLLECLLPDAFLALVRVWNFGCDMSWQIMHYAHSEC